jgi:type IV pilus assembly protein PilC
MEMTQKLNAYANQSRGEKTSNIKIKSIELITFTNQLSVMIESGVVLSDALGAISEQASSGPYKTVMTDIADKISAGESFSVALRKYPKIFGTMFISMVQASEASGKMAEMLEVLSEYITADEQTKKQVKGAMIYPLIMLVMSIVATGSLWFFVLPKFATIYSSKGAALPKLTQILLNLSGTLTDPKQMTIIVSVCLTLGVGLYYWLPTTSGKKAVDWMKINTPVFRIMFIDMVLTRSMRIMATMINTGVSLLDSIEIMKESCGNYYFDHLWTATDLKIRDGYQLSDSILAAPYNELVAPSIIHMLRAGEKSGKLGQVCDKVSVFYEKKLQNSIGTATALIEPIMIILMGGVIGTIAIALLLPVFKISIIMAH